MLKAVLFDMDGVLADSEEEYARIEMKMAKEMGFELTLQELSKYTGMGSIEMWQDLKSKYGYSDDPGVLAAKESQRMAECCRAGIICSIQASVDFLKCCADDGLKIAVATSSIKELAESVVSRIGIDPYVQAISTSCMAGKSKPEPDIFLLAASMLSVAPEECIVIEDAKNGVQAAKAAGMKAIGLRYEERPQDLSLADMTVDSCNELSVDRLRGLF